MTPFLICFKDIIILKKIKISHLLIISQNFKHLVKQLIHSLLNLVSEKTSKTLVRPNGWSWGPGQAPSHTPNRAFPPAGHCTEQSGQQRQGEIECSCFDPPSWST